MKKAIMLAAIAAVSMIGATAMADHHEEAEGSAPKMPTKAIAVITPTEGNEVHGKVIFTQTDEGVLIEAHINGLTPGKHGFHIHEYGDISSRDGTSTGGHLNLDKTDHAGPEAEKRHTGDLGNLEAGENGHAMYKRVDKYISLHDILARGVTIHAGEDDLTSQPTGAAGARVGVGVIGAANTE